MNSAGGNDRNKNPMIRMKEQYRRGYPFKKRKGTPVKESPVGPNRPEGKKDCQGVIAALTHMKKEGNRGDSKKGRGPSHSGISKESAGKPMQENDAP